MIDSITVPGGPFPMGSNNGYGDEQPVRVVNLSEYQISKYPVTNDQYAEYVRDVGRVTPSHWQAGKVPEGKGNHPVVNISWHNAKAYCTWLGKKLGLPVDLPTEAQWEKAARGSDELEYPWGDDEPTPEYANFLTNFLTGVGETTPVDNYPKGVSPYGVMDMSGNVWEWCRDWYRQYPEGEQIYPKGPNDRVYRVVRGGSFYNSARSLRAAFRFFNLPVDRLGFLGFRCVVDAAGGQK